MATGGGFEVGGSDANKVTVIVSKPVKVNGATQPNAWLVTANYIGNAPSNSYTLKAYVLCAATS